MNADVINGSLCNRCHNRNLSHAMLIVNGNKMVEFVSSLPDGKFEGMTTYRYQSVS